MSGSPRVVVVTRPTELEQLVARHGTREQARFALATRGERLDEVEARHHAFDAVLTTVSQAIPRRWRRAAIRRQDLARFVWEPADLALPVGQDGLVANVAKYLDGQLVVGVNPDRARFDGVLVRHDPAAVADVLHRAAEGAAKVERRTLVEARLDDGQRLRALNEIFVGHRTHQSARYSLRGAGAVERQSSSGLIVATGTGATGWARSIARERHTDLALPSPTEPALAFFVREAFPSVATGTTMTEGVVRGDGALEVVSEIDEGGVVFGDGLEDDRLRLGWGVRVEIGVAKERLHLVV